MIGQESVIMHEGLHNRSMGQRTDKSMKGGVSRHAMQNGYSIAEILLVFGIIAGVLDRRVGHVHPARRQLRCTGSDSRGPNAAGGRSYIQARFGNS